MTYQEALEILTRMAQNNFYGNHVQEALQMGIDALSKPRPKLRDKEPWISRVKREKGCDDVILEQQLQCVADIRTIKEKYESLPKIRGWVARDEGGGLNVFDGKPIRCESAWRGIFMRGLYVGLFREITWESEPVEVDLLIRKVEKP